MLQKILGRKTFKKAEPRIVTRGEHIISRANINSNALKVLYTLKDAGFSAYLVGGGVRDLLLGLHPKDFDVVTNAHPEEIKPLFRRCLLIGRRFRLAHVYFGRDMVEVATFRGAENSAARHHSQHGMLLRDNVYGTLAEDVWRRDFTVNGLYYNIEDFSVVDYCNGMQDLNHKILRMIGDPQLRYHEDPVRLLRAVRLAAKLDFQIEPKTEMPLRELAPLLQHVPPARLFDEVLKLFHSGKAMRTLELLIHYQLFEQLFPQTATAIKHNPMANKLLTLTCQTTDERINNDKHVSAAYLLASLLWYPLQNNIAEFLANKNPPLVALHLATQKTISLQTKIISTPRRFTAAIREIWGLQLRLENCYLKQIPRLLNHPRLRAAYDFLVLRFNSGEAHLEKAASWWTRFLEADEHHRQSLLAELPKQAKRSRRKRKS